MARTRHIIAQNFLARYRANKAVYDLATEQAEALINEILVNNRAAIHLVSARCKDPSSLSLKLYEKQYGQPGRQLTDLIATRVITYYSSDVPLIVRALREALDIDARRSVDKRTELAVVEFGYSSIHLIARTKGSWATSPKYGVLRNRWFEIQVRSVLEHGWAEIEHEIVYKSGVIYPTPIKRRFARIAGAIEILEDEFLALRDHQEQLISQHKVRYDAGEDGDVDLDSVRLIALLECERPDTVGWRAAAKHGTPFPPHIANRCVKALKRAGVRTGASLKAALRSRALKSAEALFARQQPHSEPASHLSTTLLVLLLKSRVTLAAYFPEQESDNAIAQIAEHIGRRRRS